MERNETQRNERGDEGGESVVEENQGDGEFPSLSWERGDEGGESQEEEEERVCVLSQR